LYYAPNLKALATPLIISVISTHMHSPAEGFTFTAVTEFLFYIASRKGVTTGNKINSTNPNTMQSIANVADADNTTRIRMLSPSGLIGMTFFTAGNTVQQQ